MPAYNYFTNDKVKHRIREIFLITIAVILSVSFVLIYGLNPLNHNHRLLYMVGMGALVILQLIGEHPFIRRKIRRVIYWLIMMPILIALYFLI